MSGDRDAQAERLALVQNLELRRVDAMIACDMDRLDPLLAPALIYSHSTGAVDTKAAFLERIRSGSVRYLNVMPEVEETAQLGDGIVIGVGRLRTRVEVQGALKELDARYMTIWHNERGAWALAALQG